MPGASIGSPAGSPGGATTTLTSGASWPVPFENSSLLLGVGVARHDGLL
jgi:hypothetical protein